MYKPVPQNKVNKSQAPPTVCAQEAVNLWSSCSSSPGRNSLMKFQTVTLMSESSAPVVLGKHYSDIVCRLFCVSPFLLKLPALERTPQSHVGPCSKRPSPCEHLHVKPKLGPRPFLPAPPSSAESRPRTLASLVLLGPREWVSLSHQGLQGTQPTNPENTASETFLPPRSSLDLQSGHIYFDLISLGRFIPLRIHI